MIIWIDAEKAFEKRKIQHPFITINSPETRNRKELPPPDIGAFIKFPQPNIILNSDRLKALDQNCKMRNTTSLTTFQHFFST